jgi:hypothetical protein
MALICYVSPHPSKEESRDLWRPDGFKEVRSEPPTLVCIQDFDAIAHWFDQARHGRANGIRRAAAVVEQRTNGGLSSSRGTLALLLGSVTGCQTSLRFEFCNLFLESFLLLAAPRHLQLDIADLPIEFISRIRVT